MKIFVSSTYVDLKKYRAEAKQAIEESRNEFVGMETFPSHTHEPSEFCPERVEECDAFVLLVAYRYGDIPEGEKNSITQLEYEHARKNKIPVRVYLTDDEFSCPPKVTDENRERINEFRSLLSKKHTCSYFSTPEGLYDKLTLDLMQFPVPPYIAHPYPLQANFTGREQERKMLTDWLTGDNHPMLSVIAIGGMGKTALTWYWLMEDILGSDEQPRKIVWWSFYDYESSFGRFIKKAIEYFSDDAVDWDSLESTRDQMEFLYKILCDNRFLLVLDGVERVLRAYYNLGSPYQGDEIKEDESGDFRACIEPNCGMFLQWLASGKPRTKTLLTSRLYPKELDELDGCIKKDLTQLDKDDALEFFKRQGVKGTRAEIEIACESVGYHPLYLRLLSSMIVRDPKNPGDIQEWLKYNLISKLKGKEGHNILELSYNSLDTKKQAFISRLSAFRNPMDYDAISIFNDFGSEDKFNDVLIELVERGMLFREEKGNKFDLHPIVRRYCYVRLMDKEGVHTTLRDYFAKIPEPKKIESVDDLAPVIEQYHHTVRAGRYDEAVVLFRDRLAEHLLGTFGAYQIRIELLRDLFPGGEHKLSRLNDKEEQAWTMNALAVSYGPSGQSRRAMPLLERAIAIWNEQGNKKWLAISLSNLAMNQIRIGELDAAEDNYRQKIKICHEIREESREARGQRSLGLIHSYQGNFDESEKELKRALELFKNLKEVERSKGIVYLYCAFRSLLMPNIDGGLKFAKMARKQAEVDYSEREIIRAEYFLGAAYLMKGNLVKTEEHLTEALKRDRKIDLVEFEPDILLEFAKLRFKQNHKKEALKFAEEALQIADRCEYRSMQADIHNFIAEFYLDAGELEKVKEHGEIAKERADCGYKPALEKAGKMLDKIKFN
ncbi:Tetratricopeptide (TPR) repeat [Candidatus Methanophagaceae archaeon]|nr:Tetratricopeptide (TPR) repeat [Methanophagales archaeon]